MSSSTLPVPATPDPDEGVGRRRHERLAANIDVDLNSEHNFYTGLSRNISEGGLFVATSAVLPRGTEIEVAFTLSPDPEPIKVKGRVRWIRDYDAFSEMPPGMGIEFVGISPELRDRIQAFMSRQRDSLFYED